MVAWLTSGSFGLVLKAAAGDKTFKNHLDGYNFMPFFKGESPKGRATSSSISVITPI